MEPHTCGTYRALLRRVGGAAGSHPVDWRPVGGRLVEHEVRRVEILGGGSTLQPDRAAAARERFACANSCNVARQRGCILRSDSPPRRAPAMSSPAVAQAPSRHAEAEWAALAALSSSPLCSARRSPTTTSSSRTRASAGSPRLLRPRPVSAAEAFFRAFYLRQACSVQTSRRPLGGGPSSAAGARCRRALARDGPAARRDDRGPDARIRPLPLRRQHRVGRPVCASWSAPAPITGCECATECGTKIRLTGCLPDSYESVRNVIPSTIGLIAPIIPPTLAGYL